MKLILLYLLWTPYLILAQNISLESKSNFRDIENEWQLLHRGARLSKRR